MSMQAPVQPAELEEPERLLHRLDWQLVRRLDGTLHGDYRSLFMGAGLDFAELREYQPPDDIRQLWDLSREMTARLTWKPYMFNRRLEPLLGDLDVPTLIVWGENDKVVPFECAKRFEAAIPNARIEVVADAGHVVELEEPDQLAALVGSA